ncbi:hypothetical protein ABT56_18800 [Photobacterium aquae]|uniref:Signal peptidase I n=1 Tax=Photobacterium aquae TaxID=1195763 RepID=A0A0J1JMV1_9GAMM|nr:signal peptidase I [Photobacterium aquae]KLV03487.1 hypothetical protein ABT56_18800 [Photobacterium aquae]
MKHQHPLLFPIKLIWVGIFIFALLHYILESVSFVFDFQEDKCIPEYSVYLVLKKQRNVKKGGIYSFYFSGNKFYGKNTIFGKYVIGVEGDKVSIRKNGLFINDELYSKSEKYKEIHFDNPSDMYKDFIIKKGSYFFGAKSQNSYDSRYYGTVDKTQIIGRMIPLW